MTDPTHTPSAALETLHRRAAADGRFVGWVLTRSGLAEADLAVRLGCPPENLSRLALCLRPDDGSDDFARGVRAIAAYAGCDPVALRDLLREAATLERLRGPSGAIDVGRGLLLAARDRERGQEPERKSPS